MIFVESIELQTVFNKTEENEKGEEDEMLFRYELGQMLLHVKKNWMLTHYEWKQIFYLFCELLLKHHLQIATHGLQNGAGTSTCPAYK